MNEASLLLQRILGQAQALLDDAGLNAQQRPFVGLIRGTSEKLLALMRPIPATEQALLQIVPALGEAFVKPQAALFGYAKLMLENPANFGDAQLSETQRARLTAIYSDSIALSRWTEATRQQASKLRREQHRAEAAPFDLTAILLDHIAIWRYWLREYPIALELKPAHDLAAVQGSAYHLAALVQHVLVVLASELAAQSPLRIATMPAASEQGGAYLHISAAGAEWGEAYKTLFGRDGRIVYLTQLKRYGGDLVVEQSVAVHLPAAP